MVLGGAVLQRRATCVVKHGHDLVGFFSYFIANKNKVGKISDTPAEDRV